MLAALPAAVMPLVALSQVAPDRPPRANTGPTFKYQAFAGASYTSLNQVNQSRYGLIGFDVAVTRNWGRYFGLTAEGGFYSTSAGSGNPGNPSVDMVLAGPEVHGHIYDKWSLFAHALLGGEHTGGNNQTPDVSFAGGGGVGVEYELTPRWVIRAWGDDISASFSVTNPNPNTGNSPHRTSNSRATMGVAYRF